MDLESDLADWADARAGDERAFGRVFDRARLPVRRQAARLVASHADQDDVVAAAFLELWRKRDSVRLVGGSVLPWLLVTTTYIANNLHRSTRRHRDLLNHLPRSESTAFPDLEQRTDLVDALQRLPLIDQQVLTLCVIEDWSERDAAAAMNVRAGTVKSRLNRAKKRLAEQLAPAPLTPEGQHSDR